MSILIENVEQTFADFAKVLRMIKETRILKILLLWKLKWDRERQEFKKNPAGYLESALYLQLSIQSKLAVAPIRLDLVSLSSDHNDKGNEYRAKVEPRAGLGLASAIGLQVLFMSRCMLFVSVPFTRKRACCHGKGQVHGRWTPVFSCPSTICPVLDSVRLWNGLPQRNCSYLQFLCKFW